MPVLTWPRKSPQIRHGFQAGSPGIAVRQLVPRLSPASVPGPSADCTILPEQVGGRGAEARRRLLGEHRARQNAISGEAEAAPAAEPPDAGGGDGRTGEGLFCWGDKGGE